MKIVFHSLPTRTSYFLSPGGYIAGKSLYRGKARNISTSQSLYREEKSEFFQVPKFIQRERSRNFFKFQSLYNRSIPSYFPHISSYSLIFSIYFFVLLYIFRMFRLIFSYFFIFLQHLGPKRGEEGGGEVSPISYRSIRGWWRVHRKGHETCQSSQAFTQEKSYGGPTTVCIQIT